jgi:hypothetical protein
MTASLRETPLHALHGEAGARMAGLACRPARTDRQRHRFAAGLRQERPNTNAQAKIRPQGTGGPARGRTRSGASAMTASLRETPLHALHGADRSATAPLRRRPAARTTEHERSSENVLRDRLGIAQNIFA